MLELETAVARLLAALPAPQLERISLAQAAGRIVTAPVVASIDLPPFDNSAMDGYAVRAADVASASNASPVRLKLQAYVPAGATKQCAVAQSACARIFTGAPIPEGADAVVMQEDTRREGDSVFILDSAKPGENIRRRGEDVSAGTVLIAAGTEINAGALALLSAAGVSEVAVNRRPIVGVLATGSELQESGRPLHPGQIYENNRIMLGNLISGAGATPRMFPIVRDTLTDTIAALQQAFEECDFVLTSGGVSVGELDFVKAAFEQLGGRLDFWRIAVRPGKPFVFGTYQGKFLCGLPGNPVSAFVTFQILVRPALRRWQGVENISLPKRTGVLGEAISNPSERRHFMRVICDDNGLVRSAGKQASHVLGSLAAANGLLDVPPQTNWATGKAVPVLRID